MNLSRNTELVQTVVDQVVNCIVSLKSFKALKVSYPVEVYYASADYDALKDEQASFHQRLVSSVNTMCRENTRANIQLHLVEMLKAVDG